MASSLFSTVGNGPEWLFGCQRSPTPDFQQRLTNRTAGSRWTWPSLSPPPQWRLVGSQDSPRPRSPPLRQEPWSSPLQSWPPSQSLRRKKQKKTSSTCKLCLWRHFNSCFCHNKRHWWFLLTLGCVRLSQAQEGIKVFGVVSFLGETIRFSSSGVRAGRCGPFAGLTGRLALGWLRSAKPWTLRRGQVSLVGSWTVATGVRPAECLTCYATWRASQIWFLSPPKCPLRRRRKVGSSPWSRLQTRLY